MPPWKRIAPLFLLGCALLSGLIASCSKDSPSEKEPGASLEMGRTEIQTSTSSASTESSSDYSTFTARRLLVFTDDSHALMKKVNQLLTESLQQSKLAEKVEFADPKKGMPEGSLAPDIFLRVKLGKFESRGIVSDTTKVTLHAYLGNRPWESTHHTHDSTTPPVALFTWDSTIELESHFKGLRTDPYSGIARNLAGAVTAGVSNRLADMTKRFPPLPALDGTFYGPYEPVRDPAFLKKVNGKRFGSYHGLFSHNETYWTFPMTNGTTEFPEIARTLESEGWTNSRQGTNAGAPYAEFRKEAASLDIFPVRRSTSEIIADQEAASREYAVYYRKPFSAAEREAALAGHLEKSTDLESAMTFEHHFSSEQRNLFYQRAESAQTRSPRLCLRLAQRFLSGGDTNRARAMLLRAKALRVTLADRSAFESEVADLGKRVSPKDPGALKVTPSVCRKAGLVEITADTGSMVLDGALGQPLVLFGETESGLELASVLLRPGAGGSINWSVNQVSETSGSRAESQTNPGNGNRVTTSFAMGKKTVQVSTDLLPGGTKVRHTVAPAP